VAESGNPLFVHRVATRGGIRGSFDIISSGQHYIMMHSLKLSVCTVVSHIHRRAGGGWACTHRGTVPSLFALPPRNARADEGGVADDEAGKTEDSTKIESSATMM
jgi:hypothetical protein